MNVSKRTWILFGVALLAIVAAFASLYIEKEEEIKDLESIDTEPVKQTRTRKLTKEEEVQPVNVTLTDDKNGAVTEQK
jgi:hypothetical protein